MRAGRYPTAAGQRELIAVRGELGWRVIDVLRVGDADGDRDELLVDDGLETVAEVRALARDYLRHARRQRRPQTRNTRTEVGGPEP